MIVDWMCYSAAAVGLGMYAWCLVLFARTGTRESVAGAALILGLHLACSGRVFGWW